ARPLQAAAADEEVLDVVEREEPLVLAHAARLGAGPRAEVVAVAVAAVLDDRVGDPHVPDRPRGLAEDADAVAGQVAGTQVADADVGAAAAQVDAADVDSLGPGVVAADDFAPQQLHVLDIGSGEGLAIPAAVG